MYEMFVNERNFLTRSVLVMVWIILAIANQFNILKFDNDTNQFIKTNTVHSKTDVAADTAIDAVDVEPIVVEAFVVVVCSIGTEAFVVIVWSIGTEPDLQTRPIIITTIFILCRGLSIPLNDKHPFEKSIT